MSRVTDAFKIIQSLDGKAIDMKAVLVIILFDDLSNNFNLTGKVGFVGILCFSANVISMK